MGYRTPNIDRIAKEGAIFTDHYAQQSCTAGRAAFITGQSCFRTGLLKVGLPGAKEGLVGQGPDAWRVAEAAGLCRRPIRQEPPRRSQRVSADSPWLRRVLRQPLPPQCRGGAGEPRLSEEPRVPRQVRPARRAEMQGDRSRRSDGGSALRPRRQADHRRHRSAHAQAHGNGGRGVPRQLARLHRPAAQGGHAVLLLVQRDPHAHLHAPQAGSRKARPASASSPTAWPSSTAWSANS